MRFSIIAGVMISGALSGAGFAQEPNSLDAAEAMGERFPDTLFVVEAPYESRGDIDLERSKGFAMINGGCIPNSYRSSMGKIWFVYNNRGPEPGKRDALSLLIVKSKNTGNAQPTQRVLLNAYRSDRSPWYRGGIRTYFSPNDRRPLRSVDLARWNSAHEAGSPAVYDRLFGRKPSDRFHAAPNPNGVSSSQDADWWALPELENERSGDYVVEARLLAFNRAGFEQNIASGVPFFVTPGDYEKLSVKTRSDDQSTSNSYEFSLGNCQ